MNTRIVVPLRAGSVTIVIDRENNQVWKEFVLVPVSDPPEVKSMDPFPLDDEWIQKLFRCKVCNGPVNDEHFAWAFWNLKPDYCSTKCWTADHCPKVNN